MRCLAHSMYIFTYKLIIWDILKLIWNTLPYFFYKLLKFISSFVNNFKWWSKRYLANTNAIKTTFKQLWYITIATTNRTNIIHEINHFANSLRLYMRWTFQWMIHNITYNSKREFRICMLLWVFLTSCFIAFFSKENFILV